MTDEKICAYNAEDGASVCTGDSGSALIVDAPYTLASAASADPAVTTRATIIGVVHAQPGFFLPGLSACPQPGDHEYPILFTKVVDYLTWIESVLKDVDLS